MAKYMIFLSEVIFMYRTSVTSSQVFAEETHHDQKRKEERKQKSFATRRTLNCRRTKFKCFMLLHLNSACVAWIALFTPRSTDRSSLRRVFFMCRRRLLFAALLACATAAAAAQCVRLLYYWIKWNLLRNGQKSFSVSRASTVCASVHTDFVEVIITHEVQIAWTLLIFDMLGDGAQQRTRAFSIYVMDSIATGYILLRQDWIIFLHFWTYF